jgi:bacteriocin leader peptide (microcyclamide/patellamide family)
MNKKNITPNPTQPVDRIPTGQLPSALAELSEDTLSGHGVLPSVTVVGGIAGGLYCVPRVCSYDGDADE